MSPLRTSSVKRRPVARWKLLLGVGGVWGLLTLAHHLGLGSAGIVIITVVALVVSSALWAADTWDSRDWK